MGYRIVRMSTELFNLVMTEGNRVPPLPGKRLRVTKGLPEGAKLEAVSMDLYFALDQIALMYAIVGASTGAVFIGKPEQAKTHRFNRDRGHFEPIARRRIRAGDEVWIEGDGVYLACTDAAQSIDGRWTFYVNMMIDPQTNQWVPVC